MCAFAVENKNDYVTQRVNLEYVVMISFDCC